MVKEVAEEVRLEVDTRSCGTLHDELAKHQELDGFAIYASDGGVTILNSTISYNSATGASTRGGGVFIRGISNPQAVISQLVADSGGDKASGQYATGSKATQPNCSNRLSKTKPNKAASSSKLFSACLCLDRLQCNIRMKRALNTPNQGA